MTKRAYRYTTIPNAAARLSRILRRLRLTQHNPSETVAKWIAVERRYYMPPMRTGSGTTVFFKGMLQAAPELKPGLENEIQLHGVLRRIGRLSQRIFRVPSLQQTGTDTGGLLWYTRDYFHGRFAGTMDVDLGYSAAFLRRISPDRLVRAIRTIQGWTPKLVRTVDPPRHGAYWYGVDFAFYNRFFRSRLAYAKLIGNALPVISDQLTRYENDLNHTARVASHGDLYPNNLMVTPRGALAVLDWELLNLNNPLFDPSFAALLSWRRPAWQRRFVQLSQRGHTNFFAIHQLVIATLCLRFLRHCLILDHPTYQHELLKSGFSRTMIDRGRRTARVALPFFRATLTAAIRGRAFPTGEQEAT